MVYAGGRCGYGSCSGEAIDVYSLSGKLLRTVEPGPFTTVVVVGDGSEFLLVDDLGVRKLVGREELHTAWSLQVSTRSALGNRPRWISPDRMVVWTDDGRFILIDLDGIVVYEYDAVWLAAADDDREFRDYAIVGMHAGPGSALWLWHSDRDFLIDPDSGNLTEIDVDRRIPEDFEMRNRNVRPSLRGDHLAWAGSKELLLRPLWNERETETGK